MRIQWRRPCGLWLLFLLGPHLQPPPIDPSALQTWWSAAGNLYLGESAYQVEDISFSDGVCAFNLTDGALVPVYSGKAPLSERMVGLAFVGKR